MGGGRVLGWGVCKAARQTLPWVPKQQVGCLGEAWAGDRCGLPHCVGWSEDSWAAPGTEASEEEAGSLVPMDLPCLVLRVDLLGEENGVAQHP